MKAKTGDAAQCEVQDWIRTEDDAVLVRCPRLGRVILEGTGHGGKRLRAVCSVHGLLSAYDVN